MKNQKLTFIGYFLVIPLIFFVSTLLWRWGIKRTDIGVVLTDGLAILGIYYLLISVIGSARVARS
ncbi:hypothetical protein [Rossellomorea marisflavi]|uniref:hypothetical protein n=1 Tax=Rossellomorea marisflavi TaxID=189381 RepID=UPI00064F4F19|nr:hypothetical protein [Rossellomorea marisflavi]KMK92397.1 hypothetical protein VL03_17215 [Rossellomorea marisflavi]KML08243.1 hypothetical protein VL06_01915 [Rossellomorea marisflavi]KML31316.1 hypothetical protein VL12_18445 [Rossellomorea marisflavi]MDW4525239.1 hypothetical protein [Rossellomorea marisflavi]QHA34974.1 hypothetical protein D5E69_03585 [Rossellomorea marisflavi]